MGAVRGLALDLRFALQSLRRSPGFTLIAIVTLGLGIGANLSMFGLLDGYLFRPAPYPRSDQLERIYRSTPPQGARGPVSTADYLDLVAQKQGYGEIAAYAIADSSIAEPGKPPELAVALQASTNLLGVLGATPWQGRDFTAAEGEPGKHRVLIISHRYWHNRFGGDRHIIGRTVRVEGESHQIVGVLPATFSDWRHLSWVDVFRPLGLNDQQRRDRGTTWLRLVGRRSTQVTPAQGQDFVARFGQRLAAEFPGTHARSTWFTVPIDDTVLPRDGQRMLGMMVVLSGLVLLIACSNLTNLLLVRTMARARELAVRAAMGASRFQVLRPLLLETVLLALGGGLTALFVAQWTFDWMAVHSAGDSGVGMTLSLDWHAIAWAFGACLVTALLFGLAPALFARRLDLNSALKNGSHGATGARGHRRFRHILIVGQFTLATILLASAALLVRGLDELNNRRHGWESDQLVTGTVVLPAARYPGGQEIGEFQRQALERLRAIPGVTSASLSHALPFLGLSEPRRYLIAGREPPRAGHEPVAGINAVSAHYFETVGTRILRGRPFGAGDTASSPPVFVINETMARGLFGDESALGQRIAWAGSTPIAWGEIVGVASDVESVFPDRNTMPYQIYLPLPQELRPAVSLAVRTRDRATAPMAAEIRAALSVLDGDLPVRKLQAAEASIDRVNYKIRVLGDILSALAALGLGLACLGVYGVIARTVAQRTGEFGIRLALGARAGDITRLVFTTGAKLALAGCALGLLGAMGAARLLSAAFPAMHTSALPVLAAVIAILMAIAQLACYLPARRASRISPNDALRAP